jgi:quercetin dioxygenase-like cupin family protein
MHYFGHFDTASLGVPPTFASCSRGYSQADLITRETGSVHTGLSVAELAPEGSLGLHVHSFEESFYILSGEAIVQVNDDAYRVASGDYGVFKVGTVHGWRTHGGAPVRWLQMAAPQPNPPGSTRDTFVLARGVVSDRVTSGDAPSQAGILFGHFDAGQIPPVGQRQTAAAGLEGVFLKWLIDENVGAVHHRLLFIEYQPGVSIKLHDHTYEEAYFILSGEVEGTLDGARYVAKAGDVLWTGVGCVHAFANTGREPVRWLETFAPQPPRENVFRFVAEWEQRARELEG